MEPWVIVAVLSLGGALGVNARYWLGIWISRWLISPFPWATFLINVSGSFAVGFCSILLRSWMPHPNARLLMLVGFLGGYTTYSTFAFDSWKLLEEGATSLSVANMAGTVTAGLVAVALGVGLARALVQTHTERTTRTAPQDPTRGKPAPRGPASPPSERPRDPEGSGAAP